MLYKQKMYAFRVALWCEVSPAKSVITIINYNSLSIPNKVNIHQIKRLEYFTKELAFCSILSSTTQLRLNDLKRKGKNLCRSYKSTSPSLGLN